MSHDNNTPKWTEIEHLPEWDEEFYHVYTAKKHGKWVMLKTLRPELKDDQAARAMIEKEFDVRYNLSHPNIVMINDFEDVPGVGQSIITDDVYGDSLAKLIRENKVTPHHLEELRERLPQALQYIQDNHIVHHPLRPETVIFTEKIGNLKMIDVGFEQRPELSPRRVSDDIEAFGRVMLAALDACPSEGQKSSHLRKVAEKCARNSSARKPFRDITAVRSALEGHSREKIYIFVIAFMVAMIAVLAWFSSSWRPSVPSQLQQIETPVAAPESPQHNQ